MKILKKIIKALASAALAISVISLTTINTIAAHAEEITYIDVPLDPNGVPTSAGVDGYWSYDSASTKLSLGTKSIGIKSNFRVGYNSDGTYTNCKVILSVNANLYDGVFDNNVLFGDFGHIMGGTFNGTVNNYMGVIDGGTFSKSSVVTISSSDGAGTINDGTFSGKVVVEMNTEITGGTFTDGSTVTIQGSGNIAGGTFSGSVTNEGGTISSGTFTEGANVINKRGTISGGTFDTTVTNNTNGIISGGTFSKGFTGDGKIGVNYYNLKPDGTLSRTDPYSISMSVGSTLAQSTPYSLSGYVWDGNWYTNTDKSSVFDVNTPINAPISTLYAGYNKEGVNYVKVSPETVRVAPDHTQSFSAEVKIYGTTVTDSTVSWTLTGAKSKGTTIDANGLLIVAVDETSTALTVTATSNGDSTKSGSASVTVGKPLHIYSTDSFGDITNYNYGNKNLEINGHFVSLNTSEDHSGAEITYASGNSNIVSVDASSGVVKIIGAGTTTITATIAATDDYALTEVTCNVQIAKINLPAGFSDDNKSYGDADFSNLLSFPSDYTGTITYSGSTPDVATVSSDGTVHIVKAGDYTISAQTTETDNYLATKVEQTLTIHKKNISLTTTQFQQYDVKAGDSASNHALLNVPDGVTVTYSSDTPSVAVIDNSGNITPVGAGQTRIAATVTDTTGNYNIYGDYSFWLRVGQGTSAFNDWENSQITKTFGDNDFSQTVTLKKGNASIHYSSSDTSVATVTDDGTVHILHASANPITITAYVKTTESYSEASTSYALIINKAEQPIDQTKYVTQNKKFGDPDFTIEVSEAKENPYISYSSSDTGVAYVDGSGTVTLRGINDALITAKIQATTDYKAATVSYTVHVEQGDITLNTSNFGNLQKKYSDDNFTQTVTPSVALSTITYTSSNHNVAVVDNYGYVMIKGVGSATITASVEADNYNSASAQYTLDVSKGDVKFLLSNFEKEITKTYGTGTVSQSVAISAKDTLPIDYSSDETSVATVNSNGTVTMLKSGTANIIATVNATNNYNGGSISYKLNVEKATQNINVSNFQAIYKAYGDSNFTQAVGVPANGGTVTYSIAPLGVASINEQTGEVTIIGVGTATVTANISASDQYNLATRQYVLTVRKGTQASTNFASSTINKTYGDANFGQTITRTTGDGTVSYSSNNNSIATVDAESGQVTIVSSGTIRITATVAATDHYDALTRSYTVNIAKKNPVFDATDFQAVTKTYGDDSFKQVATLTEGNGGITYTGNSPSIAIVSSDGTVKITGAGTMQVYASTKETSTYKAGSISYTLKVNKAQQVIDNTNFNDLTGQNALTFGGAAATQTIKLTKGTGKITYASNNTNVATVNETTGALTIVGAGDAVITGTAAWTSNYLTATSTYQLHVNQGQQTLGVESFASITKQYGDENFSQTVTVPNGGGIVTYESKNPNVATVNSDGLVTIVGVGTATIDAVAAASNNYLASDPVEYTLTVVKGQQKFDALNFKDVTKTTTDMPYTQTVNLTKGNGSISYSSDNENVATVNKTTGYVTVKGAGTAMITAQASSTNLFNLSTVNYKLTVNKTQQEFDVTDFKDQSKTYGDASYIQVVTRKSGDGGILYKTSNKDVADVNAASGEVTIKGVGTAVITAVAAETAEYYTASASYELTVASKDITGLTANNASSTPGEIWTISPQPSEATVTYQWYSGDTKLMNATGNTYTIQQSDAGKTIKVVVTGTGNYSGIKEYTSGPIVPKVIDGNNQKIETVNTDNKPLSMRFDGAMDLVTKVTITVNNETRLLKENVDYTLKSGSTIVILSPAYLATLTPGTYHLSVFYGDDVSATGQFVLSDSKTNDSSLEKNIENEIQTDEKIVNVNTADQSNITFWSFMFTVSLSALVVLSIRKRRDYNEM